MRQSRFQLNDCLPEEVVVENVQQVSCPHLNEQAPDFNVKTTHGDRTLADYKGKWLILF